MTPEDLAILRLSFAQKTAAVIPRLRAHLDVLAENPHHVEALEEARQFFHRIAGTAASVGLESMGRVAAICERVATLTQRGNDGLTEHLHAILDDGHRVVTAMVQDAATEMMASSDQTRVS
jgi:chemotaxis protein histidine kinase CheA